MKSIRELSESMGISKESIYKKIKYQLKVELKDHVFKGSHGTLIDDVGESLILQSLRKERAVQSDEISEEENINLTYDTTTDTNSEQPNIVQDSQVENTDFINVLKQQLTEKDNQILILMNSKDEQIRSKDLQIEHLMKINEQLINTFQNEQKIKVASTLQLQSNSDVQQVSTLAKNSDVQQVSAPIKNKNMKPSKKNFWGKVFKK